MVPYNPWEKYTAKSGELAMINIVPHQSWVIYKNKIYDLSLDRGHEESKQGGIIIQTCTEPSCNLESFLFIIFFYNVNILVGNNISV